MHSIILSSDFSRSFSIFSRSKLKFFVPCQCIVYSNLVDYGYQTTSMADRSVLVDNNTWNNTHIATVGKALCSPEEKAWKILKGLDADYVLVLFGGLLGYQGDDMNKFIWIIRISSGVYPEIQESNFLTRGQYTVGAGAPRTLLDSLMYKLSYYKFHELSTMGARGRMFDNARRIVAAEEVNTLKYFEEAFSTKNWMIRIYRILDEPKEA